MSKAELNLSRLLGLKEDKRPALGLWCPGEYFCKCHNCGANYAGDKRSHMCADCAYSTKLPEPSKRNGLE